MPQVPYQPIPDVAPQDTPIPTKRLDTPYAAFGGTIGAATEHLGQVTAGAGDELFQRAMAMQDLFNHSQAIDGVNKFMKSAGDVDAKLLSMQGKDAVDYFANGYQQDMQKAQSSIRDQLPNDMVKKMYDQESLSTIGRSYMAGARHAGEANKQYSYDTLNSQTQLAIKQVSDNPNDENLFQQQKDQVATNAAQAIKLKTGADDDSPIVKNAQATAVSSLRAERIIAQAKTDPMTAMTTLQEHKGDLTQPDYDRVDGIINTKATAVASANIATDVFGAHRQPDGTYDATVQQMQQEVRDKAIKLFPDNELLPQAAVGHLDGMVNQDRYSTRQDLQDTKQQVYKAIGDNNVVDVQHLLAIPGMDHVVDKLPPSMKNDLQGYINRYNAAQNKLSDEQAKNIINGISNNNVEQFTNLDLTDPKYHLSQNDITHFQTLQAKLTKDPVNDPSVMHAQRDLRASMGPQLQALGIYSRDKNNPDDFDHFTGALQEALNEWRQDHKTPATSEDVVGKIGPMIMNQQAVSKGYLWNSSEPAFRQFNQPAPGEIPEGFRTKITNDLVKQGLPEPIDVQVQRAYTRMQFQKLYGKMATSATTPPNSQ